MKGRKFFVDLYDVLGKGGQITFMPHAEQKKFDCAMWTFTDIGFFFLTQIRGSFIFDFKIL